MSKLCWAYKVILPEMVREIADSDYNEVCRDSMVKKAGFQCYEYNE